MALTVYFLRHGQTSFSRENAFCGSGLDPDLTAVGLEMAQSFAAAYRSLLWSAIYSSTLKRTLTTAQVLSEAVNLNVELQNDLREISYGRWEGMTIDDVSREYHDDYLKWLSDPAWNSPTEGESAIAIAGRGLRVVEKIKQLHSDGNVLVVSHKATIRTVLCALLGIDVGRFRYRMACPVASVSVVEFGNYGPLIKTLADVSHLGKRLREQPGT